jgi:hypothetical protein
MALTLEKELRLARAGLVSYFEENEIAWTEAARDAYAYIEKGFAGQIVRPDDVVAPLKAVVEIDAKLKAFLSARKLSRQLYWVVYYTELVLDRVWDKIKEN